MAVPKLANILGTIEDTAARIGQAVPVIRSTVQSVTTIASGKNPQPTGTQLPATVSELTPQVAVAGMQGALVIGAIAVLIILMFSVRK